MGSGTDVAVATADAALTHNRLTGLAQMIDRARATRANFRQNIGIALGLDGLQNAWITMHTVRVRARKKNLSEKFGLENHEEDPD